MTLPRFGPPGASPRLLAVSLNAPSWQRLRQFLLPLQLWLQLWLGSDNDHVDLLVNANASSNVLRTVSGYHP